MRILFDSKQLQYKTPFGTLVPDQICTLNIHIPSSVQAKNVTCVLNYENGVNAQIIPMTLQMRKGPYDVFQGSFSIACTGLYFYFFRIEHANGSFRLFKQGDDTNMEAGDQWQVSCVPADFKTPDWAKGATIYQVFPDRFAKSGKVDLTGKLEPYTVHPYWQEEVEWRPTPEGIVLNNDFYGGNFRGIAAEMDYIASLGSLHGDDQLLWHFGQLGHPLAGDHSQPSAGGRDAGLQSPG